MARDGCTQLTYIMVAPPRLAAEGERIFRSHRAWMQATHYRDGNKALLSYDVSRTPELSNPLDPNSEPTGNTIFILNEVYRTDAGVLDHFEQAAATWVDYGALVNFLGSCVTTVVPRARIVNSLW